MKNWRDRANCVGQPLKLFFPEGHESPKKAKILCEGCPVHQDCLDFILTFEEPTARYGIYAGLTVGERNRLFGSAELAS